MMAGGDSGSATKRRRERRLRSAWRHEQLSVAMALAAAAHHSAQPNAALRGQKPGTRAKEGEVREEHLALRGQTRLPPGMRPALLVEVQPQGRVGRHFAEHMAQLAPLVQILDAPVPQLGEQLVDIFNIFRLWEYNLKGCRSLVITCLLIWIESDMGQFRTFELSLQFTL